MSGRVGRIRTCNLLCLLAYPTFHRLEWVSHKARHERLRYFEGAFTNSATTLMLSLALSGCIHTQPESVKVFINVPVPCVKQSDLPKPPNIQPDAELAKLTDGRLITTIAAERLDLRRYHSEASAILTACTTP